MHLSRQACGLGILIALLIAPPLTAVAGEDWLQLKFDCRHSGDVSQRDVVAPLGLLGAVPLSDAVLTAPVVADGRVYAVDASGVAFCIDAQTLQVVWKRCPRGGAANCNNVSSPALAGGYLHFGTTAGWYYVVDAADGSVVAEIDCGEPIFSAPVVANGRVYFATLGARVYALQPDGQVCWVWDYVEDQLGFHGDRFSGQDWLKHKQGGRVTWRDQFCCSVDLAAFEDTVVVPAGGKTI